MKTHSGTSQTDGENFKKNRRGGGKGQRRYNTRETTYLVGGGLPDRQDFSSRLPGSEQSLLILIGDVGLLPVSLLGPSLAVDEEEGARGMCIVGYGLHPISYAVAGRT